MLSCPAQRGALLPARQARSLAHPLLRPHLLHARCALGCSTPNYPACLPPAALPSRAPASTPPLLAVVSFVLFPVRARGLLQRKMASTLIKVGDLAVWTVGQVRR